MSIREVTMYIAECDRCGALDDEGEHCAWTDREGALENATDGDWREIGDRIACPNCSMYDDDDGELVMRPPLASPSHQPDQEPSDAVQLPAVVLGCLGHPAVAGDACVQHDPAGTSRAETVSELRMGIYRHYKGPLYQVLGLAHDANEDGRVCVVYMPLQLDGAHEGPRLAVRTLEDFAARVHPMDDTVCEVCVHGPGTVPRFEYLGPEFKRGMLS